MKEKKILTNIVAVERNNDNIAENNRHNISQQRTRNESDTVGKELRECSNLRQ